MKKIEVYAGFVTAMMVMLDPEGTGEIYKEYPVLAELNKLAEEKRGTKDSIELEVSDDDHNTITAALESVGDIFIAHARYLNEDWIKDVINDGFEKFLKSREKGGVSHEN